MILRVFLIGKFDRIEIIFQPQKIIEELINVHAYMLNKLSTFSFIMPYSSPICNMILLIIVFSVIEAYDAAEQSMVRLNKTGAKLMHKYSKFYIIN